MDPILSHFRKLKPASTAGSYRQYGRLVQAIEFAALEKGMSARAITEEILKLEADRQHKRATLYGAVCYHIRKAKRRLSQSSHAS